MFKQEEVREHDQRCNEVKVRTVTAGVRGEWESEPNRIEWEHLGMPCLMVRNPYGLHWCGYVGIEPGHPAHGKNYSDLDLAVHGGLTYSKECDGVVCHKPKPGEPDELHWLGFDCAHLGDLSPGTNAVLNQISQQRNRREYKTYKTEAYVKGQVELLAQQLSEMRVAV